MIINGPKRFEEIMNNPTPLPPSKHFSGIYIPDSEFINVATLCEISRKETLKKLYALRDISNSILEKKDYISSVRYRETIRPEFTLLFDGNASLNYKITEKVLIDNDGKIVDEKKAKEKGIDVSTYYAYTINEDILDHLLHSDFANSKLDKYIREKHKYLLEMFKDYLESGIFYHDMHITDSTGTLKIVSHHDNYFAKEVNDSIIIPEGFGDISFNYKKGIFKRINVNYLANQDIVTGTCSYKHEDSFGQRVYVHKSLLPEAYSKEKK